MNAVGGSRLRALVVVGLGEWRVSGLRRAWIERSSKVYRYVSSGKIRRESLSGDPYAAIYRRTGLRVIGKPIALMRVAGTDAVTGCSARALYGNGIFLP